MLKVNKSIAAKKNKAAPKARIIFTIGATIFLLLPLLSNFAKFYYTKNYDYLIEMPCDPEEENCFIRDCSIPDECPPNEYSIYKQFYVKAYDFEKCHDNSCERECELGLIECTPIICGESETDSCSGE